MPNNNNQNMFQNPNVNQNQIPFQMQNNPNINNNNNIIDNSNAVSENVEQTQYLDENQNPIDMSSSNVQSPELEEYYAYYNNKKIQEENNMKLFRRDTTFYTKENENNIKPYSYSDLKKAPTTYLKNELNNLTYMTCVIQCLANIKPLILYYLNNKKIFVKYMHKAGLNYYLSRIIINMYSFPEEEDSQKKTFISVDNFRIFFYKINKFFKGNSVKNAEIFLNNLLDILNNEQEEVFKLQNNNNDKENKIIEKEGNENKNNMEFIKYYKNLIDNNKSLFFNCFNYVIQKQSTCQKCGQKIEGYQNFSTFDANIGQYMKYLEFEKTQNDLGEKKNIVAPSGIIGADDLTQSEVEQVNQYIAFLKSQHKEK